jgi:acyl-CoA synthetase (AMP-forming)/AMP-acid ligase II
MFFRGPYPNMSIPDVSLPAFIVESPNRRANKPALIDGSTGTVVNYGELADKIGRFAAALAALGFCKGDIFASAVPNCPEFAIAFYGVASLGGATTMMNPLYTVEEMTRQLIDANARWLLAVPDRLDVVREAASRVGIERIIVMGDAAGTLPFSSLLDNDEIPPEVAINSSNDVVVLPYSSGTTGRSKGVMLTHRNLIANALLQRVADGTTSDDTLVAVFPFFHIGGLSGLSVPLHAGATLVLMPRFDLATLLRLLQDYQATRVVVPPPVVLELSRNPIVSDYDLSALRHIQCGAAPIGESVLHACQARLRCTVWRGYALTEASSRTHTIPTGEIDRPGSSGPPLPNVECRIVDVLCGAELEPGQPGEICIRGPIVMTGYLNQPEATAQAIDSEGWLHTGDLGYADADGWLYVVDRLKEVIKYNAYQVAPAELEAVLLTHPAVADAAVIPTPDERTGEIPKAFIVLTKGASASPEEIMAFVSARVAPYKKVRQVEFVEEIPKSATGKILRRVLVEHERSRAADLATNASTPRD